MVLPLKMSTFSSSHPDLMAIINIIIIIALSAAAPGLGFFFLALLPALLFFYSATLGKFKVSLMFLVSFFGCWAVSSLLNLYFHPLSVFLIGLTGMTIAEISNRQININKIVMYPPLLIIFLVAAYLILPGLEQNETPWELLKGYAGKQIDDTWNIFMQFPLAKEDIDFFKQNELAVKSAFLKILPALTVCSTVFLVWINVILGKFFLQKNGVSLDHLAGLSEWKAPEKLIWLFILSGAASFLPHPDISFFSVNVFLISSFIYVFQGFAIISCLFRNKSVPVFFRYLFYIFVAVEPFLMIAITIIGLFDLWIDFRRFFVKKQESP